LKDRIAMKVKGIEGNRVYLRKTEFRNRSEDDDGKCSFTFTFLPFPFIASLKDFYYKKLKK
jgi:hypothetical protein